MRPRTRMAGCAIIVHGEDHGDFLRFRPVPDTAQQETPTRERGLPVGPMAEAEVRRALKPLAGHTLGDEIVEKLISLALGEDIQESHRPQSRGSPLSFFGAPPTRPLYQRLPSGMSSGSTLS